jgi:hypothetical protein
MKRVFKDLTGLTAVAMFQNHAAAAVIRDLSEEGFISAVRRDYQGSRLCLTRLRQAHSLAAMSVGQSLPLLAVTGPIPSRERGAAGHG